MRVDGIITDPVWVEGKFGFSVVMHILVCYMWYLRQGGAGIKRFNEFCKLWAEEHSARVTVLTSQVEHNAGKIFDDCKGKPIVSEKDGNVEVVRVGLPDTYSKGFAGRAFAQISWSYRARNALKQLDKPDIVIASSPHLWITLPGVAAKRRWSIPLILEIRDLWPESIVQMEVVGKNHPGVIYLGFHEKWAYRQADHIVTVVTTQINNIAVRGLYQRDKMSVVTNGIMLEDYENIPPSKRGEIRAKLGVQDWQKLVMYIGAHGKLNDLIKLVHIAEVLKERKDIKIISVGEGPERQMLISEAKARGLDNLEFIGPVASEDVPAYLTACDIGCSLLNTRVHERYDNKTWGVFRNTYFDYAGARKPVVFNIPGFPVEEIEKRAKAGLFASTAEGGEESAEKIVYLADHPEIAKEMGENSYREIAVRYNRRKMAAKYYELMTGLVKHKQ